MIEKFPVLMLYLFTALLLCRSTSCNPRTIKDHAMVNEELLIRRFKAQDWMSCILSCQDDPKCEAYNYQYKGSSSCELYRLDAMKDPVDMKLKYLHGFIFQHLKRDKNKLCYVKPPYQDNTNLPQQSSQACKALKREHPNAASGQHWLDIDVGGPLQPFPAYCDMETDGGGWTLVWSYTVHSKAAFANIVNCVHPLPKNMTKAENNVFEIVPQNETDFNAIDFAKWSLIGNEFLIKSNTNNWVSCVPGTGGLVSSTNGNVTCKLVKEINQTSCFEIPGDIEITNDGFILEGKVNKTLTYFYNRGADSFTNLTIHPCEEGTTNNRGSIYLR